MAHIPGKSNITADKLSRKFNDDLEWALDVGILCQIENVFGEIDIDLFASRLNAKADLYVSRYPEPEAYAIDAFTLDWSSKHLYIFPPFSLLPRILQKLMSDQGTAVLIAPIWTTQSFWPKLMSMLIEDWIELPRPQRILYLPHQPETC